MAARTKTIDTADVPENLAPAPTPAHPELDAATRQLLADFRPVVEQRIDDVIAEFLQYVSAWPEMRLLTRSAEGKRLGFGFGDNRNLSFPSNLMRVEE